MDENAIYCSIGKFVLAFQAVESKLREIIWFCTDPEHITETRKPMAGEAFMRTVARARKEVPPCIKRWGGERAADLLDRFDHALDRCRALAHRRNRILHSGYIFHESGDDLVGITRAYLKSIPAGGIEHEYEALTEETFEIVMREIGEIFVELGAVHLQLIH